MQEDVARHIGFEGEDLVERIRVVSPAEQVLADPQIPTYLYDGALVMGNLLNAAQAVGVNSCYIFRAKEVFEGPEGKELLKQWGLPERMVGVGNCILGYAAEDGIRPPLPRKPGYIVRT